MYSKRSPSAFAAGIELPNISIPANCGITPSTGFNLLRRYSSMVDEMVTRHQWYENLKTTCPAVIRVCRSEDIRILAEDRRRKNYIFLLARFQIATLGASRIGQVAPFETSILPLYRIRITFSA